MHAHNYTNKNSNERRARDKGKLKRPWNGGCYNMSQINETLHNKYNSRMFHNNQNKCTSNCEFISIRQLLNVNYTHKNFLFWNKNLSSNNNNTIRIREQRGRVVRFDAQFYVYTHKWKEALCVFFRFIKIGRVHWIYMAFLFFILFLVVRLTNETTAL